MLHSVKYSNVVLGRYSEPALVAMIDIFHAFFSPYSRSSVNDEGVLWPNSFIYSNIVTKFPVIEINEYLKNPFILSIEPALFEKIRFRLECLVQSAVVFYLFEEDISFGSSGGLGKEGPGWGMEE